MLHFIYKYQHPIHLMLPIVHPSFPLPVRDRFLDFLSAAIKFSATQCFTDFRYLERRAIELFYSNPDLWFNGPDKDTVQRYSSVLCQTIPEDHSSLIRRWLSPRLPIYLSLFSNYVDKIFLRLPSASCGFPYSEFLSSFQQPLLNIKNSPFLVFFDDYGYYSQPLSSAFRRARSLGQSIFHATQSFHDFGSAFDFIDPKGDPELGQKLLSILSSTQKEPSIESLELIDARIFLSAISSDSMGYRHFSFFPFKVRDVTDQTMEFYKGVSSFLQQKGIANEIAELFVQRSFSKPLDILVGFHLFNLLSLPFPYQKIPKQHIDLYEKVEFLDSIQENGFSKRRRI